MLSRRAQRIAMSVIALSGLWAGQALALPTLQLYLEGGTYDEATETWLAEPDDDGMVRLWAIGDVEENGGSILDVKLAVAYQGVAAAPTVTLTGSTTGGYGGFADPSTAAAPTPLGGEHTDGSAPTLYGGGALPDHGIYDQPGIHWQEFALGDFTLVDSKLGDFQLDLPTPLGNKRGQINVYEVRVEGLGADDPWVHFDLYNHVQSATKGTFAPFSHDAGTTGDGGGGGGGGGVVPEPATLVLLGTGLLGLSGASRRRKARGLQG